MNNTHFVEKSLKMPYCNNVGYLDLNNRKVFCSFDDKGEYYFDKVDEEYVRENLHLIAESEFSPLPRAVVKESPLILGNTTVTCGVLSDGRRIIKDTGLFKALGRVRKGEVRIEGYPPILGSKALVDILEDLYPNDTDIVIPFEVAQFNGTTGIWYDANAIPMICDLYLEAEYRGIIKSGQQHVLRQSKILLRSLAKVGITALIDEATNYQQVRGRDELQVLLARFITDDLKPYSKQFPKEYFEELFRLYGLPYDPTTSRRPPFFAQFNLKYVYGMLPQKFWEEIERFNPTVFNTNKNRWDRKNHIHRNLTEEGLEWLKSHLTALIPVMAVSSDIDAFKPNFNKAFARKIYELDLLNKDTDKLVSDFQIDMNQYLK